MKKGEERDQDDFKQMTGGVPESTRPKLSEQVPPSPGEGVLGGPGEGVGG